MRTHVRRELERAFPILWHYQLTLGLCHSWLILWRLADMKLGDWKLLQYLQMVRLRRRPLQRPHDHVDPPVWGDPDRLAELRRPHGHHPWSGRR